MLLSPKLQEFKPRIIQANVPPNLPDSIIRPAAFFLCSEWDLLTLLGIQTFSFPGNYRVNSGSCLASYNETMILPGGEAQ